MSRIRSLVDWFSGIDWTADKLTAAATVILAVFTVVLALGTLAMWFATRRLVRGAERATEHQLRAYVGVHQLGYQGLEDDRPIGVGFCFTNHGQTPAMQFNLRGAVDLLPYPLPQGFELPEAPERARQDAIIFSDEVNPLNGWVWERADQRLSIETKREILARHTIQEIYAHGIVTYLDIFRKLRATEFCFFLNPVSVVRNRAGDLVRNKKGALQFQWAPVEGRNNLI